MYTAAAKLLMNRLRNLKNFCSWRKLSEINSSDTHLKDKSGKCVAYLGQIVSSWNCTSSQNLDIRVPKPILFPDGLTARTQMVRQFYFRTLVRKDLCCLNTSSEIGWFRAVWLPSFVPFNFLSEIRHRAVWNSIVVGFILSVFLDILYLNVRCQPKMTIWILD
jgi:hypothetical protein